MEVYRFDTDDDTYSIPFDWDDDDKNIDYVDQIVDEYFDTQTRVSDKWQPTFFGIVNPKQKVANLGTLVSSNVLVFDQRAVDVLQPLLGASVELLPYETEVGIYYLVNVLDAGDYLDRQRTECREIRKNGTCYGITKYVFQADLSQGKHLFIIPDTSLSRYVSGEFIAACRQHDLKGIFLTDKAKIWDSAVSS